MVSTEVKRSQNGGVGGKDLELGFGALPPENFEIVYLSAFWSAERRVVLFEMRLPATRRTHKMEQFGSPWLSCMLVFKAELCLETLRAKRTCC